MITGHLLSVLTNGNVAAVQSLLDCNANIHARRKDLWTPLHAALWSRSPDVLRLLLEHGAALEAQLDDHSTPLHIAADNGNIAAIQSLLDCNMNILYKHVAKIFGHHFMVHCVVGVLVSCITY